MESDLKLSTLILAAIVCASSLNALAISVSGSVATMGFPLSPPWRASVSRGKIMRRVLKARALGQDEGDLTTLEE